jgi:DNA-binding response OmpR family regulator
LTQPEATNTAPRVLLVDDQEALLRANARILTHAGYSVETAADGAIAALAIERTSFDVILSDIDMPGMNGIALLERVRAHDLDVPVVLITGNPSLSTAIRAVEQGALRYLLKPVDWEDLVKVTEDAVRLHRIAKARRQALDQAVGDNRFFGDRAGLAASFDRALESLHIAYQPIVAWASRKVYAHEALMRSREPSLPHPGAVIDAAERLGRVHELGRRIRAKAVCPALPLADDVLLFLNLHPSDLLDEALFSPEGSLATMAGRIVLEITERASLDGINDVRSRVASLRKLGFRIAVDDLAGCGKRGRRPSTTV